MKRVRFLLHSNAYKFGTRLKELRVDKGLTQEEFRSDFKTHNPKDPQEEVSVTLDTIQNWEQHYNLPNVDTLLDLADYFGVNVDYLLGRIDRKTHEIDDITEITLLSPKAVEIIMSNRKKIFHAPLTDEEIERNNQAIKDIENASWEPLPEYTIDIDRRNVQFLNHLIESKQFKPLYELFEFYLSEKGMSKYFKDELDWMNSDFHHLTESQKREMSKLYTEYELRKHRTRDHAELLIKAFSDFVDGIAAL